MHLEGGEMEILRKAQAGSLESCDVLVEVEPHEKLIVEIESDAWGQFGSHLERFVEERLAELGVEKGRIVLTDRGALDYTLAARIRTALERASSGKGHDEIGLEGGADVDA